VEEVPVMRKFFPTLMTSAIVFLWILMSQSAFAITIGFDPDSQNVNLGDPVTINLTISDLGDHTPESLGTFDLNLLFDPTILGIDTTDSDGDGVIDSVDIDPRSQLDIYGWHLNSMGASLTGPGVLNIYDLSFDDEDDLNNYQDGSFPLATITFSAIGVGTSMLSVDPATILLGDAAGNTLTADLTGGSVSVSSVSPVPEPTTCLLMGAGLASLIGLRRKKL